MTRRKSTGDWDGWGWLAIFGVVLGAATFYYTRAGVGENDAALLPNRVEDPIDFLIAALNEKFGKAWVTFGLYTLQAGLAETLPPEVVGLVNVVYQVEVLADRGELDRNQKKQRAVQIARGW